MAYELPAFYDATNQVIRPMDTADQIPPAQVPVSARANNQIQNLPDGLYLGPPVALPLVIYVNTATGVDAPASGAQSTPYKSLDYALGQIASESNSGKLQTSITVALQAGQTFTTSNDVNIYDGTLTYSFYGDPNYGAFNTGPVGSGANPWMMTDLQRPIIAPQFTEVNSYWHLAGVNVYGGNVALQGVTIQLPAAPAEPAISLYSQFADFVRTISYSTGGYLDLQGAIVNMTDITSFWGLLGLSPRSTFNLIEYGSQFQIGGVLMNAAAAPTAPQLAARSYFIKFYPDFVGNNQQQGVLYDTALTATPASGKLTVLWGDTESFVVETTKTNLLTFPICYDLTYGLRNYMYGVAFDSVNRPWNVNSSREI
jgi:hypothetical protein